MAEPQEGKSSAEPEYKLPFQDEKSSEEILSSWESMPVMDDAGFKVKKRVFDFSSLPKKKAKAKKVDLSDLDFSSRPKKAPKISGDFDETAKVDAEEQDVCIHEHPSHSTTESPSFKIGSPCMANVMEVKKNEEKSEAYAKKLEYGNLARGTTNTYLILRNGILIGTDTRTTEHSIETLENPEGLYNWLGDTDEKFHQLSGCLITAEGNAERNHVLWAHLDQKVAQGVKDLHKLVEAAYRHLIGNPGPRISLYLAGFSETYQTYLVYHLAAEVQVEMEVSGLNDQQYSAIGSGAKSAMHTFECENVHPDMAFNDAANCIVKTLMNATVDCACTGGLMNVHWLTRDGCVRLEQRHFIDLMLARNMSFNPDTNLFFFSQSPYSKMNYDRLRVGLKRRGFILTNPPSCLGVVSPGWTFFKAEFFDSDADIFYNTACTPLSGYENYLRSTLFNDNNVDEHVIVTRVDLQVLADIRLRHLLHGIP